jgi:sigma-B regulation protein RsbU (phosphoserine phosphatase)
MVVTRPVADLANAAGRIAAGDLEASTNITTRDELGELGRAFNDMVPQLADRMRLRESLNLAMEVQQNLLPDTPPKIEGLDVAGRSLYCDETGGDYYDFIELTEMSPHCLGIVVGDVTGHGIAAALLMATARALLRSRADRPGGMAAMMDDINHNLAADVAGHRFMTLVYMMIDAKNRALRWVNAGHDAPIVYDPTTDRFDELVGGDGIPLGIEGSWSYEEHSTEAAPGGQIIVIGTDGIWEARNPKGNMFGKEALRDIIREYADRTAEDISLAVTETLTKFRKTRSQEDDITLVVVKILPKDADVPP